MAEAVAATAAAVSAAKEFVFVTAATAAANTGASLAVATTVGNIAVTAVTAAAQAALSYGVGQILKPGVPSPDFQRQVKRQSIPERVSGYGRALIGGAYVLWETGGEKSAFALNVFAMHQGLIDGWEDLYLNDDLVTILPSGFIAAGSDLRYGKFSDLVRVDARRGLPTETHYSLISGHQPDLWPITARGDSIASLAMAASAKFTDNFSRDYPNGLPVPRRVARMQYCWDPRLGPRGTITNDSDKQASAAWVWTQNPVLHLLDYMTNTDNGMGLPLSLFLPRIASWITAANVCDELVPLAAGGTVRRYQSGGLYAHSTEPVEVINVIRQSFDGWLAQDTNGVFVVEAGKYYAPTVTFDDRHIISLSYERWNADERATNEIIPTFVDPERLYAEVETDAWTNHADIAETGTVRSARLQLPWVQNNSQARRLGKIALGRASVSLRGTVVTTLDGLRAFGERRIRIQSPNDGALVANIVVEPLNVTLNTDFTVTIPWSLSLPEWYDWNAATEEGNGPGGDVRPPPISIPTPVISEVVAIGVTAETQRMRIFIADVAGIVYNIQWRVAGTTEWTRSSQQISAGAPPFVETDLVPSGIIEVQVAEVGASGAVSEWSATATTADIRVTESGDVRITESSDTRILE